MNILDENRKIILMLIMLALISCALFTGCSSTYFTEDKDERTQLTHDKLDKTIKSEIAQKLFIEFKDYYNKFESNYEDRYSQLMAFDKMVGLMGIYKEYLSDSQLEYVKDKSEKVDVNLWYSPAFFGYSESGLHFVALNVIDIKNIHMYENAINKIREDENAFRILDDASKYKTYLWDLYIEDLTHLEDAIDIDLDIYKQNGTVYEAHPKTVLNSEIPDELKNFLSMYGREIFNSKTVQNKSWNLYYSTVYDLFSGQYLRITIGDEKVYLINSLGNDWGKHLKSVQYGN